MWYENNTGGIPTSGGCRYMIHNIITIIFHHLVTLPFSQNKSLSYYIHNISYGLTGVCMDTNYSLENSLFLGWRHVSSYRLNFLAMVRPAHKSGCPRKKGFFQSPQKPANHMVTSQEQTSVNEGAATTWEKEDNVNNSGHALNADLWRACFVGLFRDPDTAVHKAATRRLFYFIQFFSFIYLFYDVQALHHTFLLTRSSYSDQRWTYQRK